MRSCRFENVKELLVHEREARKDDFTKKCCDFVHSVRKSTIKCDHAKKFREINSLVKSLIDVDLTEKMLLLT